MAAARAGSQKISPTSSDQRPVVVVHADDFLNPSAVRYAKGRWSPEGFWLDSYNYDALCSYALDPLVPGGDGWYRSHSYDPTRDCTVEPAAVFAPANAVVVVEGIFLHRDELLARWDASVFLHVPFTESAQRMAVRDGTHPDPDHQSVRRYVDGQRIYFATARPWNHATLIVDNTDFENPRLIDAASVAPDR